MTVLMLFIGLAIGGIGAWALMRERLSAAIHGKDDLANQFKALSAEALRQNNDSFLTLAQTRFDTFQSEAKAELEKREQAVQNLMTPIKETLEKVDTQVAALEQKREKAYGALTTEVRLLHESQDKLRTETTSLVTALRSPSTRGQWGEMQLKRVLEMAGMLPHCDFIEQPTTTADDRMLRPDVVVKLAGGKNIVIDSKVPLQALLDYAQAESDDVRASHLATFVRHVHDHMTKLSAKAYWQQFRPSPDFVVMFLPSESFYRYAIENDATLLELGPSQRVILASPTTLIALLLAAAAGWREATLAESARAISDLGRELYERMATMGGHLSRLGGRLDKAVEAFNETVGSLERRVLVSARRFPELGVASDAKLPQIAPIERMTQKVTAGELADGTTRLSELTPVPPNGSETDSF
jgi:DNA recombination protein RmuC